MTAPHIIDPAGLLSDALAEASPDLMRALLQSIINTLLSADADGVVGAEWGQPSPGRSATQRLPATATWTPRSAPSTSRSRSCAPAPTSPTGSSSGAKAPSQP